MNECWPSDSKAGLREVRTILGNKDFRNDQHPQAPWAPRALTPKTPKKQNTNFQGFMGMIHVDETDDMERLSTTSAGPPPEPEAKLKRTKRMPLGTTLETREGERKEIRFEEANEDDLRVIDGSRRFEDQEGEFRIELGFSASAPTIPARERRGGIIA